MSKRSAIKVMCIVCVVVISFSISFRVSAAKSSGTYPTRKGAILVTADAYKGLLPTGHAAIVYNKNTVVESLIKGVTTGNNDWNRTKKTVYGVGVRKTSAAQDISAADWCYSKRGKPYNWNY
ncbi:MAG: hypothetical protein ACK5MN_05545 [Lachnospiraceae bacterium]